MKSRDLVFLAIVVVVVGGLYFLSTKNKAKPMSPNPPEHLTARAREQCFTCHSRELFADLERQHKHPGKWSDERVSCLFCHTAPDGSRAVNRSGSENPSLARLPRLPRSTQSPIK
jgi:hypothetical protein